MEAAKRSVEFPHHVAKRRLQRRPPSDEDVIVPGT
jgi:hypothetical protein